MTDHQLAAALNCAVATVQAMPLPMRLRYERLALAADEIALWEAGVAALPADVIVCRPRRQRR